MERAIVDYQNVTRKHSMKSKERPWALTKESPTCEIKKDHEGPKAQKEEKRKKNKNVKKKRTKLRP